MQDISCGDKARSVANQCLSRVVAPCPQTKETGIGWVFQLLHMLNRTENYVSTILFETAAVFETTGVYREENKMEPTNPNANTFEKLHMSK